MIQKLIMFCVVFTTFNSRAQFTVSYYPVQSVLGLSVMNDRIVWGDFKMETNNLFSNLNMELSPKCNFVRKPRVHYYFGIGASFNLAFAATKNSILNGYFLDVGTRIKPFEKVPQINLILEISPLLNTDLNNGIFRTRFGVSYGFKKRKQ